MARVIKLVLALVMLGFIALTGYAYMADLTPASGEVTVPVTLDAE